VVVHGEAEEDREEEDGQPGLDASTCWKTRSRVSTPSWVTRTNSPYAAPTESRFMITALIGTTMERKTTISRMKLRPRTKRKTIGV
jgi:hypothetical protein